MPPNSENIQQSTTRELYLLVALGLLALLLGLTAINSPFEGNNADDWTYLYIGQRMEVQSDWLYGLNNRQFHLHGMLLSHLLMPGRFQGMLYIHLVSVFAVSVSIFHIFNRIIPGRAWFAFLISAAFIAYIPGNPNHPTYWIQPLSLILLFNVLATVLIIESMFNEGRKSLYFFVVGLIVLYPASRGYESLVPYLSLLPFGFFIIKRKITREAIIKSLLWWGVIGISTAQFVIPYVGESESSYYQLRRHTIGLDLSRWVSNTLEYNEFSFPSPQFIEDTRFDYLPPALLITLIFWVVTWLLWRRHPGQFRLPSVRLLILLAVLGILLVNLNAIGVIYASVHTNPHTQFFSLPGHAMLIVSLMSLLVLGGRHFLQVRLRHGFAVLLTAFFVLAGQWFYGYHAYWSETENLRIPFSEHTDVYNDISALLPNVEDNTLILTHECQIWGTTPVTTFAAFTNLQQRVYATRYLYGFAGGSNIQLANLAEQRFAFTGIDFTDGFLWDVGNLTLFYGFDQMIVLGCDDGQIEILDSFPRGFTHPDASIDAYNPYARISDGFIPASVQRILAR